MNRVTDRKKQRREYLRKKRKIDRFCAWWFVLYCGIPAVSAQTRVTPVDGRPLISWAHKVMDFPEDSDISYRWLPDASLITFDPDIGSPLVTNAYRVDLESGKRSPLDAYNRTFKEVTDGTAWEPVLSPNHQWLFWFWSVADAPNFKWYALRLDGTQYRTGLVTDHYVYGGVWSNHSDEWITIAAGMVIRYHRDHPNRVTRIPLSIDNRIRLVGLTADGEGIAADENIIQPAGSLDLYGVDVRTGNAPTRKWTVHLPEGAVCCEFALSPHADRCAWIFFFKHPLFDRQLAPPRNATFELWISDLNGQKMHRIGYQDVEPSTFTYGLLGEIEMLRWSPNGKQISFVYHQTVYVLPAE